MPAGTQIESWLQASKQWVEPELERALANLPGAPLRLVEACRYALLGGGKRLRPALVRLAGELLRAPQDCALGPAASVELVHTYSLVHDDLPCMDDDDLRRGRPTCHKVFGEAMAVLVGDALQCLAFEWLARSRAPYAAELVTVLARAAGPLGMVGGQVLDMEHAAKDVGAAVVAAIHELKTARLIAAALELGAVAAGATVQERAQLARFGLTLGRCFQTVDDILDVTGDREALGKTPGKDLAQTKPTMVAALGLAGAQAMAVRLADEARADLCGLAPAGVQIAEALLEYLLARRN